MKKILLLFLLIAATAVTFAAERPRWVGLPITVYIPQYGNYSALMKQAFLAWQNDSRSLVRFEFLSKPTYANIEVEFVDFVANCGDANAVGCTETSTYGGNYKKAYVTIGTKEYQRIRNGSNYSRKIVDRTRDHIYGVMLHEAGHAIGLGHSQNKGSIMYPYDLDDMQYLTKDDMQLLYNKYH